jgi:ribonuclease D
MCEALVPLLQNPAVLKLMHSPSEDLVAFGHSCGTLPAPMFDTQAAAALCGLGAGLGYQKLVQAVTDIALTKGQTRSDWLRRPLSPAQLDYAADDVRHLHALHHALHTQLESNGRLAWLNEDSARQLALAGSDDADRWPHLALRSAQFLDSHAQQRLLRLLRWRDAQARHSNRPRSWILDNELAVTLARQNPPDFRACATLLDAAPKSPRSLRESLWDALTTPLEDEAEAPKQRGDDRNKAQLRAMQQAVTDIALASGIPDTVLASRRLLESLQDGQGWEGALAGWRRRLLEPTLAPLLKQG